MPRLAAILLGARTAHTAARGITGTSSPPVNFSGGFAVPLVIAAAGPVVESPIKPYVAGTAANVPALALDVNDKSRRDLPALSPKGNRAKASAAVAREIAESADSLQVTVKPWERDFYANSSRDSMSAKQRLVMEWAETVLSKCTTIRAVPPLTEVRVTKAAACFNGAHYTTGGSHLSELKYLHIETNHEVPGWLIRVLELCERSFKRGKGPPERAPDIPLEDCNWSLDYLAADLVDLASLGRSLIIAFGGC